MATDPGLLRTQRWMQAFIVAPDLEDEAALEAPGVQAEIPKDQALAMVIPSASLSEIERVSIYRHMYLDRLGEALETDYPAVLHFLGQKAFYQLAARYVQAFPSRSYTLNRLGDRFPEFLAARTDLPKHRFLHDLARLELALTEVFDERESPVLSEAAIAAIPPDAWDTARLKPIAAFRLLSFEYPVSEYLAGVDGECAVPRISRRPSWVVGYRSNYHVHRLDLKRHAFELLSALASGVPVGVAVTQVKVSSKQLFGWFREWTSEGLFQSVE